MTITTRDRLNYIEDVVMRCIAGSITKEKAAYRITTMSRLAPEIRTFAKAALKEVKLIPDSWA